MNLDELWLWIAESELSFQIGATWLFPFIESIHVLMVVTLVGSIFLADLRTLGRVGVHYEHDEFVAGLTRVGWAAFVPAVITGIGLFISRPDHYAAN